MKIKILVSWIIVSVGLISVRADDNPSQAAARAALAKMLLQLERPQPPTNPALALAPRIPQMVPPAVAAPKEKLPVEPSPRWDAAADLKKLVVAPPATNGVPKPVAAAVMPARQIPAPVAPAPRVEPKKETPVVAAPNPVPRPCRLK